MNICIIYLSESLFAFILKSYLVAELLHYMPVSCFTFWGMCSAFLSKGTKGIRALRPENFWKPHNQSWVRDSRLLLSLTSVASESLTALGSPPRAVSG